MTLKSRFCYSRRWVCYGGGEASGAGLTWLQFVLFVLPLEPLGAIARARKEPLGATSRARKILISQHLTPLHEATGGMDSSCFRSTENSYYVHFEYLLCDCQSHNPDTTLYRSSAEIWRFESALFSGVWKLTPLTPLFLDEGRCCRYVHVVCAVTLKLQIIPTSNIFLRLD